MINTPILFVVFNRPKETAIVFDSIRKAAPKYLYIAADGPRPNVATDFENCSKVKDIIKSVDWDCDVKYLYQDKNLGCGLGPRAAFDWFFSHVSEGIILEDDCLPTYDFFIYCQILLERYRDNDKIFSINGCNLGYNTNLTSSYTFSKFMNMWGWATWKRSYQQIDYNLNEWGKVTNKHFYLYNKLRNYPLDLDIGWIYYWKKFFDLTSNTTKVSWWDFQWIYNQLAMGKLSIVPSKNLVKNIGFNIYGTHTLHADNPAANIGLETLEQPYQAPASIKIDLVYEENYVKKIWCNYNRLPNIFYLKKFLRKQIINPLYMLWRSH